MIKTCFKCRQDKPIDDFYKHSKMADGHLNKCKECTKIDTRAHYEAAGGRPDYERTRNKRPERKAAALLYNRKRRAIEPQKYVARYAVSNALRDKRLTKEPCARCGSAERVQAHHHDYSKPLDVEWLCFKCHREHAHGQTTRAA